MKSAELGILRGFCLLEDVAVLRLLDAAASLIVVLTQLRFPSFPDPHSTILADLPAATSVVVVRRPSSLRLCWVPDATGPNVPRVPNQVITELTICYRY